MSRTEPLFAEASSDSPEPADADRSEAAGLPAAAEATPLPPHRVSVVVPMYNEVENAAPMVKAILDAITMTGWWPDDNSTYVTGPDYRPGEPSVSGRYAITIIIQEPEQEQS